MDDLEFKVKVVLEYDGSEYHGWQRQPNQVSIQSIVEEALRTYFNSEIKKSRLSEQLVDRVKVKASGRTDSGVHALGQVISFLWPMCINFEARKFLHCLNGITPDAICFKEAVRVPLSFDAQYSAMSKQYLYKICYRSAPLCLDIGRAWRITKKIDLEVLKKCLTMLEGTHDFASFRAVDCNSKTTNRTILKCDFEIHENMEQLYINCLGTGFLKNMVRHIVSTVISVSSGDKTLDYLLSLLNQQPRDSRIKMAPACGLYLKQVNYTTDLN